jgi:hypothetical protein
MGDWRERLTGKLEPILRLPDPRPAISAYHDMPYAIFCYRPEDELALRQEVTRLMTRLEQAGKRVTTVSLAECLNEAVTAVVGSMDVLADAEREHGTDAAIATVHEILSELSPLDTLVASRIPADADPLRDVVLIVRAGALFPVYRTSSLLDQLHGRVRVPAVLFYPGDLDGAGLRFMGALDAEHNYRPKIY